MFPVQFLVHLLLFDCIVSLPFLSSWDHLWFICFLYLFKKITLTKFCMNFLFPTLLVSALCIYFPFLFFLKISEINLLTLSYEYKFHCEPQLWYHKWQFSFLSKDYNLYFYFNLNCMWWNASFPVVQKLYLIVLDYHQKIKVI